MALGCPVCVEREENRSTRKTARNTGDIKCENSTRINHDKQETQNKTNCKNRHLVFLIFKKKQENDGVDDISSLFQRHCQTNRLDYKQTELCIYKVQSWQAVVSQSGEEH